MITLNKVQDTFLEDFCSNYWGKSPVQSNTNHVQDRLSEEQIFRTVVKGCALGEQVGVSIRFFANGQQVKNIDNIKHLLPVMADKNFSNYHQRVLTELNDYTLIVNEPEIIDYEMWAWCRNFLKPIFDRVGLNNLGVYNAIFIGNYSKTPFGVHFDPESVFHVPIVGTKKMRVWPCEYVEENAGLIHKQNYEEYIGGSTLIEAKPGGWLYWAKPYWHISESNGDLSVSMALSLNEFSNLINNLTDLLHIDKGTESEKLSTVNPKLVQHRFSSNDMQKTADEIPSEITDTYHSLQQRFSDEQMKRMWLRIVSGYGFLLVPMARRPVDIDEYTFIQGDQFYPIIWSRINEGITLSANGLLADFPWNEDILKLVDLLNSGTVFKVSSLKEKMPELDLELAINVIETLLTFRACNIQKEKPFRTVVTI